MQIRGSPCKTWRAKDVSFGPCPARVHHLFSKLTALSQVLPSSFPHTAKTQNRGIFGSRCSSEQRSNSPSRARATSFSPFSTPRRSSSQASGSFSAMLECRTEQATKARINSLPTCTESPLPSSSSIKLSCNGQHLSGFRPTQKLQDLTLILPHQR